MIKNPYIAIINQDCANLSVSILCVLIECVLIYELFVLKGVIS